MQEIICDAFASNVYRTRDVGRFTQGLPMKVILTGSRTKTLSATQVYEYQTFTCCQNVRDTDENWFYIIPPDVIDRVKTWLKEIAPQFPSLEMEIIEVPKERVKILSYAEGESGMIIEDTNISISMLPNRCNYPVEYHGGEPFEFKGFHFIYNMFSNFCVAREVSLTKEIMEGLIDTFLDSEMDNILSGARDGRRAYTVQYRSSNSSHYSVGHAYAVIDTDYLTKEKLREYLVKIVGRNLQTIQEYVRNNLKYRITGDIPLLKVLYSKHSYSVERYLAHILLRAAFAKDMHPFIDQYFLIKEKLPDIYFWNLILLTQFGFNINYYYWLTDARLFKMTDEKEFKTVTKNYGGTSANSFFGSYFKSDAMIRMIGGLITLYKRGEFKEIYDSLMGNKRVAPTDAFKAKSSTFRICKSYTAMLCDGEYYWITNDDYNVKKCKKQNFIEV